MDLLPSSFSVFSYECNYTLFDTSIIHKPSFTHTDSNLVDFPLSKSCYLVLTKFSLSAITCVPAWSYRQLIKYYVSANTVSAITYCIWFYWINSAQVSLKSFWLPPSFVCTKQNTFFSSMLAKLMDIYIHTHTWQGVRKRQGLGETERLPTCAWKPTPSLPDWKVWKEEIILQEFKKHLPHHLCAENGKTEKSLSQDNAVSFSNMSGQLMEELGLQSLWGRLRAKQKTTEPDVACGLTAFFYFFKLLRKSKFRTEVLLKQCILCERRNELDTRTVESTVSNGQPINPVEQIAFCFGLTWLLYQKTK